MSVGASRNWHDSPSANSPTDKGAAKVKDRLEQCLSRHLSAITAASVVLWCGRKLGLSPEQLDKAEIPALLRVVTESLTLYFDDAKLQAVLREVRQALPSRDRREMHPLFVDRKEDVGAPSPVLIAVRSEADVTLARAEALRLAVSIGFSKPDAVKLSTVVSELSRNIFQYAKTGMIQVKALIEPRLGVEVVATDHGPGIRDLDLILKGKYRSQKGMGLGLIGSKRLMDKFEIQTAQDKGTSITAVKYG